MLPLRHWLHRIAHREFLQAVRRPRSVVALEEIAELPAPRAADWTEAIELRDAIRKLPAAEGEIVRLTITQTGAHKCPERPGLAAVVRARLVSR